MRPNGASATYDSQSAGGVEVGIRICPRSVQDFEVVHRGPNCVRFYKDVTRIVPAFYYDFI